MFKAFLVTCAALFSIWFTFGVFTVATTFVTLPLPLPALVEKPTYVHVYNDEEYNCLHENIFFEARNQSPEGQAMVGIVTLVRSRMPEFPNTICGVVHEWAQFSWTSHRPKINLKNKGESYAWWFTGLIARNILINSEALDRDYKGLAYYHTTKVSPRWAKTLNRAFVINDHVFYTKATDETLSFVLR